MASLASKVPRVLILGLGFEGILLALAWVLTAVFALHPWSGSELNASTLLQVVLFTLPMLLAMWAMAYLPIPSIRDLDRQVRDIVEELFADSPLWVLLFVSMAAGLGEEWLFRGVLQTGLEQAAGAVTAIAISSLAFGLAHAISRAYFLASTLAGAYLGVLYWWSDNLWLVVLVHAAYDLVALRYYQQAIKNT